MLIGFNANVSTMDNVEHTAKVKEVKQGEHGDAEEEKPREAVFTINFSAFLIVLVLCLHHDILGLVLYSVY